MWYYVLLHRNKSIIKKKIRISATEHSDIWRSYHIRYVVWNRLGLLSFNWLIDYLRMYVPLKNISLIWRRHLSFNSMRSISNEYKYILFAADSVCKSSFDIRSVFSSRQSTDKQVDVTGVSTISFAGSFPQISRSLQWSYLPIQPFVRSHAVWYVNCSWHNDLDNNLYRLLNL
jgi:hypothetical protein